MRRRVAAVALDRAFDVVDRTIRAAEPRLDVREPIPPFRIPGVDRSRGGVRIPSRGHEAVRFTHHREAAPPRTVAAILRDAVERLLRRLLHVRRERAAIGKLRKRRLPRAADGKDRDRDAERRHHRSDEHPSAARRGTVVGIWDSGFGIRGEIRDLVFGSRMGTWDWDSGFDESRIPNPICITNRTSRRTARGVAR